MMNDLLFCSSLEPEAVVAGFHDVAVKSKARAMRGIG